MTSDLVIRDGASGPPRTHANPEKRPERVTAGGGSPAYGPAMVALRGRALHLVGPRDLTVERVETPTPPPGHVRCRVLTAGVCGTDIHLWNGRDDLVLPHVLGHDFCASVDALGDGVDGDRLPVGLRVTANPSDFCGECSACRRGAPNLCRRGRVMGMQDAGCFQDFIVLRADRLVPVPDEVSDLAASVLEPVAVALHVHDRVKPLIPVGRVVTIGAGPIGLVTGRLLAAAGYEWLAVEPIASRRETALTWGAHSSFEPGRDDDAIVEVLGDEPAVVVACAAGPDIAPWSLRIAPPGSAVAVVGNSPTGYPGSTVMLREISVVGVRGGTRYGDALRIVSSGLVDLDSLITDIRSLDAAPDAFLDLEASPGSIMRMALTLAED